jgi:hypothetical protein
VKKSELKTADLARIDSCLMSFIPDRYSKVAFVIGQAMLKLKDEYPGLPDKFYASRIKHLAAIGVIEAVGNLDRIRFSEVRLTEDGAQEYSTRRRGRLRSTIHSILALPFVFLRVLCG